MVDPVELAEALEAFDEPLVASPYLVLAHTLRKLGEPEEEVHDVLVVLGEHHYGDDEHVVFEILYGDGSVLGPSEAL